MVGTAEERLERRARIWVVVGIPLLFVVSALVAGFVGLLETFEECGLLGPPPAHASHQGAVCGDRESVWNVWPWVAMIVGAAVPPAAAIVGHQRYDGVTAAVMGIGALVLCPILVAVAISAPSDQCSAEQQRQLPRRECSLPDPDDP